MASDLLELVSACCRAPLRVDGSDEGTSYYRCTSCGKASDPAQDTPGGTCTDVSPCMDILDLAAATYTECYLEASTPTGVRQLFASNEVGTLGAIRSVFEASNPNAHFRLALRIDEKLLFVIEHDAGATPVATPIGAEQFQAFRRLALAA